MAKLTCTLGCVGSSSQSASDIQDGAAGAWQNILKSPSKKRKNRILPDADKLSSKMNDNNTSSSIFATAPAPSAQSKEGPSSTAAAASTSSLHSLSRSPAKRGLAYDALSIPGDREDKENQQAQAQGQQQLMKSTRSNTLKVSTASLAGSTSRRGAPSPRSPAPCSSNRGPLGASLRSPGRTQQAASGAVQPSSPGSQQQQAPQSPITRSKIASPSTARPASRVVQAAQPQSQQQREKTSSGGPKKVVDDVFMLDNQGEEESSPSNSSQEDGDDEEVADILLGYTSMNGKTPAKSALVVESKEAAVPPGKFSTTRC